MKFKKLLISASAIAAGSGLLATVLTSCAKANVDDKLKVTLDDNGLLYDPANMKGDDYKLDYKSAIKAALSRSSNWVQFKNALADEIVCKWFEDRMAPSKDSDKKNSSFRTSYDEWVYQIDKDYNTTVQNCKNKYGANWGFYLQNEYLAPYGGTEASYKHAKLVEKVKADFISKVFAKTYFGYQNETPAATDLYPHIYSKATKNVNKDDLRNPDNWGKIGFFARTELSFDPGEKPKAYSDVNPDWLAKHPDGDYAAIQDYVFNRWFKTEKPFFASAALFKYSNPKHVAHAKLDEIYDGTRTGVTIPTDKPSEAFPFFGAGSGLGTDKANAFIKDMIDGNFATKYTTKEGEKANGTITIPTADSEDGQTCLLVCGNQMYNTLVTPYAMACGNLYAQMFGGTDKSANILPAATVKGNITKDYTGVIDDFNILSNFFYKNGVTIPSTLTKVLDLNTIYGGMKEDNVYHCPLFLPCTSYTHFYGDENATDKNGIRYIANTIQVDDFNTLNPTWMPTQPWVMELNEFGMHVLTIDGYQYVNEAGTTEEARLAALKKVVMFRLLQKQSNDEGAAGVSTDLLGDSGKLKTYFSDNFTNIILELATFNSELTDPQAKKTENDKYNVFRTLESYKTEEPTKVDNLFLHTVWNDEKLCSEYTTLTSFLLALDNFEETKKAISTLEAANTKIYSYRSKQISNSKAFEKFSKTIFENGLLAPFAYVPQANNDAETAVYDYITYDYNTVNRVIIQNHPELVSGTAFNGWRVLKGLLLGDAGIVNHAFISDVVEKATVNGSTGFSPQITDAKNTASNRYWYKSNLVDKFMYSFMGNKSNTANAIKQNAYNYYISQHNGDWFTGDAPRIWTGSASVNAFATTYARSKVISGDNNLATYIKKASDLKKDNKYSAQYFYTVMDYAAASVLQKAYIDNGQYGDEYMNYILFQATVAYLTSSDKTTGGELFDNFYTVLNSKIGEDDTAIVGYLANGRISETAGEKLSPNAITKLAAGDSTDYDFNPNVDNMFDKFGYAGDKRSETGEEDISSRTASSSHWNVVQRYYGDTNVHDFGGFTGLQTKSNNQLDSASGLQSAVFNNFAKATYKSYNVQTGTQYETQNNGCWFQFAGSKDSNGKDLTMADLTVDGETFKANEWFPIEGTAEQKKYAPVRKIAKKIREYATMDDLRTLAKTLADSYDGRSDFADIADGTTTYPTVDAMRMGMLKLLPSTKYNTDKIHWFQRVKNVEAHTIDNNPSVVFKDATGKNSYKLLMTQLNKADALEKTITPDWDETNKKWVMKNADSPITPEEFWVILFNMASESTVQQRAITEIVKCAFGDKKLIVYDAQLYNQFDSVWIKDWTKKTMGA